MNILVVSGLDVKLQHHYSSTAHTDKEETRQSMVRNPCNDIIVCSSMFPVPETTFIALVPRTPNELANACEMSYFG